MKIILKLDVFLAIEHMYRIIRLDFLKYGFNFTVGITREKLYCRTVSFTYQTFTNILTGLRKIMIQTNGVPVMKLLVGLVSAYKIGLTLL